MTFRERQTPYRPTRSRKLYTFLYLTAHLSHYVREQHDLRRKTKYKTLPTLHRRCQVSHPWELIGLHTPNHRKLKFRALTIRQPPSREHHTCHNTVHERHTFKRSERKTLRRKQVQ